MSVYVVIVYCGTIHLILTGNVLGAVVSSVSANSRSLLTGDLPPGENRGGTNVCQAKAAGAPVASAGMSWATGITTPILERHGIAIYPREWWAPSKTATHIATGRMASVGLYGAPIRPRGGSRHGPNTIGPWTLMTPHRGP